MFSELKVKLNSHETQLLIFSPLHVLQELWQQKPSELIVPVTQVKH